MKASHETLTLWLIGLFLCILATGTVANTKAQERSQLEARQLWEQAIAAKGGRNRLYAVRNVVVIQHGELRINLLKKISTLQESLFVFPNRIWTWNDMRPSVFGLTVDMWNYESHKQYVLPYPITPNPHTITDEPAGGSLMYGFLDLLPETKWLKPTLVRSTVTRVKGKEVDVVQTSVNNERVDFSLDRKTHLPIRISYFSPEYNNRFSEKYHSDTPDTIQDLSDYAEVSGIKVPQRIKYDDGSEYKISFQFDVEYNEGIFVNPPPIEAGPEAWKAK
jgi:hypothetical protein